MNEQHLRIRAQISEIAAALEVIRAVTQEAGLNEQQTHQCQLAVDEVCTNIIEHGYGGDNVDGVIDIVLQLEPERLTIKLLDDSRPFNPLKRPDPDPHTAIEDRENTGGWGIFFVKKFMDEVTYSYNGRNQLTLVKNLSLSPGIAVTEHPNGVWLVSPKGHLEQTTSPALDKVLTAQLEAGHQFLILDLSKVKGITAPALRVLVNQCKRARDLRGDLVLAGMSANVNDVLKVGGFDLVFTMFETVDEAIRRHKSRK